MARPLGHRAVDGDEDRKALVLHGLPKADAVCCRPPELEPFSRSRARPANQDVGKRSPGGLRIARGESGQPLGPAHDAVTSFSTHAVEALPEVLALSPAAPSGPFKSAICSEFFGAPCAAPRLKAGSRPQKRCCWKSSWTQRRKPIHCVKPAVPKIA